MKFCVLSESLADEAAIRILIATMLGQEAESIETSAPRSRGWPSIKDELPKAILHLQYRTSADGLVVVVDGNGSPFHRPEHEGVEGGDPSCRMCVLRGIVQRTCRQLRPRGPGSMLKVAVGVAVPSIEAWYACGSISGIGEAAWALRPCGSAPEEVRRLKREVYGTDRPGLSHELRVAVEQATRLRERLDMLEELFPAGFAALRRELAGWRA